MAAPLYIRLSLIHLVKRSVFSRTLATHTNQQDAKTTGGSESGSSKTHFGFQTVSEEEKGEKVYRVFEQVATTYDLMNDAMSAGVHRVWKDIFMARLSPSPGTKLLDVAGGTGDIALRFLKYVETPTHLTINSDSSDIEISRDVLAQVSMNHAEDSQERNQETQYGTTTGRHGNFVYDQPQDHHGSHVTVCDINQPMLNVGREKALRVGYTAGISWVQGNAECLPLEDNTFDVYTIAYGIRNCTHVQEVLNEAYRVLKPGGRFMCLEFSEVKNPLLRSLYNSYSFQVIPVMGQLIAGDWRSYQYLVESIRRFPNQEDFSSMIKTAGFRMVTYENLTFGVTAIHSGFKI